MISAISKQQELVLPARRFWTREEYERAGTLGLFGPAERLELIDGEIVTRMPQNSAHTTSLNLVAELIRSVVTSECQLRIQAPLSVGDRSQPEPDIAVVSGSIRDYARQHPTTAILIVEIADTSLTYDRTTKAGLYAQAEVAEYWIVNLIDRVVEVHRQPTPMAERPLGHYYRSVRQVIETETVAPLVAPEHAIAVADLLP